MTLIGERECNEALSEERQKSRANEPQEQILVEGVISTVDEEVFVAQQHGRMCTQKPCIFVSSEMEEQCFL